MQTTAKGVRKELKQFITVYQWILEFSLEKVWLEVIVKHNKADPDDMLDDINAKLIEVCEEYLWTHKVGLDKFQLATIVMDLYTQTISALPEPFKVIAKESKNLVKEYLEANKSKREALERIKDENDALDKEIIARREDQKKKLSEKKVVLVEKSEMPAENSEAGPMGPNPTPKKKKKVVKDTDSLAIDNFVLPRY